LEPEGGAQVEAWPHDDKSGKGVSKLGICLLSTAEIAQASRARPGHLPVTGEEHALRRQATTVSFAGQQYIEEAASLSGLLEESRPAGETKAGHTGTTDA
jgi:hypothetical protein